MTKANRLSRSARCSSSCSLLENKLKDPVCEIEATLAENTKRYGHFYELNLKALLLRTQKTKNVALKKLDSFLSYLPEKRI